MNPSPFTPGASLHEARYYTVENHEGHMVAHCRLCPHECIIADGHSGLCRSRMCRDGRLWALSYGEPCALAIDPIEKKPLLHYHPGTQCLSVACTGCNLRCLNCQNSSISQTSPWMAEHARWSPDDLVRLCLDRHLPAIAYTYTEPLTWIEYMADTARLAHEHGLRNILVSAGYVNETPLRELLPLIDAANIDLKSLDDDIYHRLNGASLSPVQRTLRLFRESGAWIEITNLLVDGWNTAPDQLRKLCHWLAANGFTQVPLHFSRCFPAYRLAGLRPTPLPTMYLARDIAHEEGIQRVHLGNV